MKAFIQTTLFILISCMLNGQDFAGEWNGALNVQGNQIRIVLHVNKVNDLYEATMDSPDQNASGIKVTSVRFSYPNVTLEISSIGAIYEGVMTDEGITGKWVQSGTSLFLALLKSGEAVEKEK